MTANANAVGSKISKNIPISFVSGLRMQMSSQQIKNKLAKQFKFPLFQDYECKCRHNTCGPLCDKCCPMFNQKRWRPGKFISANECERCQCFGHADECFFDPQVFNLNFFTTKSENIINLGTMGKK